MTYNKPLLTTNNAKTVKGEKLGYRTFILYLSPYTQNSKNINVCSHASEGCAKACLFSSGFGGMYTSVMQGRVDKTEFFLRDRLAFLNKLKGEIEKAIRLNEGKNIVTFRLNGTSDLPYEKYRVFDNNTKNIFEMFPDVVFYDYTKNYIRFEKQLPANYHLTFSRSETNHDKAMEILSKGFNVAIVFDKLPETFAGVPVINGDENDLRFKDPKGVVVGLKYKKNTGKGGAEKNILAYSSGFVLRASELQDRILAKVALTK